MTILNLTQHLASPDQLADGVVDLTGDARTAMLAWITAEDLPSTEKILSMADGVTAIAIAAGATQVMIGGAPWFMAPLVNALQAAGITPLFAFSRRVSVDQPQPDGTVRKVAVFKHEGWIPAC